MILNVKYYALVVVGLCLILAKPCVSLSTSETANNNNNDEALSAMSGSESELSQPNSAVTADFNNNDNNKNHFAHRHHHNQRQQATGDLPLLNVIEPRVVMAAAQDPTTQTGRGQKLTNEKYLKLKAALLKLADKRKSDRESDDDDDGVEAERDLEENEQLAVTTTTTTLPPALRAIRDYMVREMEKKANRHIYIGKKNIFGFGSQLRMYHKRKQAKNGAGGNGGEQQHRHLFIGK
jgi:hypothetical protein